MDLMAKWQLTQTGVKTETTAARRSEGTAVTDSVDGMVTVDIGGEAIDAACVSAVKEGDIVQILIQSGKALVLGAAGWGDGVEAALADISGAYVHVKYSAFSDGEDMTDLPDESTLYMGICSDDSPTAPTDKTAYTWALIKGDQGVPGTSGYLHIKYSDDGETFSGNAGETVGSWMGTCVNDNETDPTDFGAYTWAQIKGNTGVSISTVATQYAQSISKTTAPASGWSEVCPEYVEGQYVWSRVLTTYDDGTTSTSGENCILTEAAQEVVDSLQIGGRNLLRDTVALGSEYWGARAYVTVLTGQTDPTGGTNAVKLTQSSASWYFCTTYNVHGKIPERGIYTFSAYVRADVETTSRMSVRIGSGIDGISTNTACRENISVGTTWTRISITTEANVDASHGIECWFGQYGTDPIYIAYPKFEKGNKATDWTPAPEDVDASIETVDTKADEAAKTATNYLNYSADCLEIGYSGSNEKVKITASDITIGDEADRNVLIDSDSIDIRSGTSTLASFSDGGIALGDATISNEELGGSTATTMRANACAIRSDDGENNQFKAYFLASTVNNYPTASMCAAVEGTRNTKSISVSTSGIAINGKTVGWSPLQVESLLPSSVSFINRSMINWGLGLVFLSLNFDGPLSTMPSNTSFARIREPGIGREYPVIPTASLGNIGRRYAGSLGYIDFEVRVDTSCNLISPSWSFQASSTSISGFMLPLSMFPVDDLLAF